MRRTEVISGSLRSHGDLRFALNDVLDRIVPLCVLPYAIWTMYVHLITATHSSFDTLMRWLPAAALVAVAATIAWFRLPEPANRFDPATPGSVAVSGSAASWATRAIGIRAAPFAVLALAILWVGLLSAGMPYPIFWWVALLGAGGAWVWNLRGGSWRYAASERAASEHEAGKHAAWIVLLVAAAAVCVTLIASRPDADDAFYRSISATLLRFPQQPVLVHDTLYRLPGIPVLLQFYRLSNYDVLVGTLARITGVDHLVVAYLILPSAFAAFCVVAWVYLLRRIVPARWPSALLILFLCVLALGEMHRAYGNFAFVRLFQGKAILATCMVPVVAASALLFARHGGLRYWLLLFVAEIAALGVSASALFVAPAAAALGLAGGWSPNAAGCRRFVSGILASAYLVGAAWAMTSVTHGGHALVSSSPMPNLQQILDNTWGWWSTRLLLVALLAGWAFVVNPARARYLSAGAFFFLLAALNPYTVRIVADHFVGVRTYWRLTWVLPLPFFLAVLLDGVIQRAWGMRSKVLAACVCAALAGAAIAFGWHFGTLRGANGVTLGAPGLKVNPVEYQVAVKIAENVPEQGVVLAPQSVSIWLPSFVVHPELLGVRGLYLTHTFPAQEAIRRSLLMRYVAGQHRTPDSEALLADALQRYGLTAVVLAHSAPWYGEMESVLERHGWQPLASGAYDIWVKNRGGTEVSIRAVSEPSQAPSLTR
jgi:hypothetical protein